VTPENQPNPIEVSGESNKLRGIVESHFLDVETQDPSALTDAISQEQGVVPVSNRRIYGKPSFGEGCGYPGSRDFG
jgi:hypothetical protein